jgi:predicted CopG family antitoxin
MVKVNKTISVENDLWYNFKKYCLSNKKDMSEVISDLILKEMKGGKTK